ncbi:hypothetical protein [Symbiopectobacterium purcellii]|uniref:Uncharacterized protein n=1 Tax=Symbiopectobacterium purcellii TaxID=2871826 RepID=A0ABX9ARU3_9ENTR|nr:hypothetical protein [Symbiopectobacterium purcellii]QZN97319.1 hypothetical protein K6K13_08235 [Symbiopectobacterium purcellii]
MINLTLKKPNVCVLNVQLTSVSNEKGNVHSTALAKEIHSIYNRPSVPRFIFNEVNIKSGLNKHGNTFQGLPKSNVSTQPGCIKNVADQRNGVNKVKHEGCSIGDLLNKHGNNFQGLPKSNVSTQPGCIKNVADQRNGVNKVKHEGCSIGDLLNKHGNNFQGLPKSNVSTQPGCIKNVADQHNGVNKVKHEGCSIGDLLNKHGNTFQGLPHSDELTQSDLFRRCADKHNGVNKVKYKGYSIGAPLNKNENESQGLSASMKVVRDVSKRNSIDIESYGHFLENEKLFPVTSEAEVQVAPVDDEGDIKPITFKDNKSYYQIAFVDDFVE